MHNRLHISSFSLFISWLFLEKVLLAAQNIFWVHVSKTLSRGVSDLFFDNHDLLKISNIIRVCQQLSLLFPFDLYCKFESWKVGSCKENVTDQWAGLTCPKEKSLQQYWDHFTNDGKKNKLPSHTQLFGRFHSDNQMYYFNVYTSWWMSEGIFHTD